MNQQKNSVYMVVKHHINAILLFSIIAANTKEKVLLHSYAVFQQYTVRRNPQVSGHLSEKLRNKVRNATDNSPIALRTKCYTHQLSTQGDNTAYADKDVYNLPEIICR